MPNIEKYEVIQC